jgi:large subunit ribosomal protein L29
MNKTEMRALDAQKLNEEMLEMRRELFNLNLQKTTGQLTQTHRLRQVKKRIACAKTILTEKASEKA